MSTLKKFSLPIQERRFDLVTDRRLIIGTWKEINLYVGSTAMQCKWYLSVREENRPCQFLPYYGTSRDASTTHFSANAAMGTLPH
jgi:hypothetical protein